MEKDSLVKGTMFLTISGTVVKLIGVLNWIFLARVIGGEGMGLYQMAFPLYLLALNLASAGIPVAVAVLIAGELAQKNYQGIQKILRVTMYSMSALGLFFSFVILVSARWLIERQFFTDTRVYYALIALAPAIFLVSLLSGLRGFFQGLRHMLPTAASEVIEQVVRVLTMVALAYYFLPRGIPYAVGGASRRLRPCRLLLLYSLCCRGS